MKRSQDKRISSLSNYSNKEISKEIILDLFQITKNICNKVDNSRVDKAKIVNKMKETIKN